MLMARPRIMVVRGDAWSSRAIEGFGGGWPSHMANLLSDGSVWDARDDRIRYGRQLYLPGVRHRPAGYLAAENSKWAIFEAGDGSEAVYDLWLSALASQEGKPYDRNGILDFATGLLTGEYKDQNYAAKDSKAWFCDEYAIWAAGQVQLLTWPLPLRIFSQTPGSGLNLFIGAGWKLVSQVGFTS
jgi:hypothetical protein